MEIGMIGLGRMGTNMVQRLMNAGHTCVVYDTNSAAVSQCTLDGAVGAASLADVVQKLAPPRAVWMMLPAAIVDSVITQLRTLLSEGDIIIDGGNSYYHDDIRRAGELQQTGVHYIDVGVSGGIWGAQRGYCMMIGGEQRVVHYLDPIFAALAPGIAAASRTPGRERLGGSAEQGYVHCGPSGAGHFVKMVHNGIEYGLMAAYAEGFNILRAANIGQRERTVDAETAPLRHPEQYHYSIDLRDVAEVWRRGSVISSWLLDLTAEALLDDPELTGFNGRVADSGEGRWTLQAAIDESVSAPVLSAALFARFDSRGTNQFADKLLSAMRYGFGGHHEQHPTEGGAS